MLRKLRFRIQCKASNHPTMDGYLSESIFSDEEESAVDEAPDENHYFLLHNTVGSVLWVGETRAGCFASF